MLLLNFVMIVILSDIYHSNHCEVLDEDQCHILPYYEIINFSYTLWLTGNKFSYRYLHSVNAGSLEVKLHRKEGHLFLLGRFLGYTIQHRQAVQDV